MDCVSVVIWRLVSDSITSTCCGFEAQLVTARCTTTSATNRINAAYSVLHCWKANIKSTFHNRSPQRVVEQTASLTTSWTTCRTARHNSSTPRSGGNLKKLGHYGECGSPQRGPGAEPLVSGSGGAMPPPEAESFSAF